MRQWQDLYFILYRTIDKDIGKSQLILGNVDKDIGKSQLILGNVDKDIGLTRIAKSEELFNALGLFNLESKTREIPIQVYVDTMLHRDYYADFFEDSLNYVYSFMMRRNGKNYYGKCKLKEPYEYLNNNDLYGSNVSIKITLLMENPYFYSDYVYEKSIGYERTCNFYFPYRLRDFENSFFAHSVRKDVVAHAIDNVGNTNNGIVITIKNYTLLTNPKISNLTTEREMKINIIVEAGGTTIIDTESKTVYVNGIYRGNVKELMDDWLKLQKGINVLLFSADGGTNSCEVIMKYRNKYKAL